jgi:predicted Zn-dependent protease
LLHGLKDPVAAAEEYRAVVSLLPTIAPFRHAMATALANAGKRYEAINELEAILKMDKRYQPARETLGQLVRR